MITEDYVSFETAKLLKEKGFDEPCIYVYRHDGSEDIWDADKEDIACQKPTLQMAMKWLREKHNIFVRIIQSHIDTCTYEIYWNHGDFRQPRTYYDTYEEACEIAIKYCLEHLI